MYSSRISNPVNYSLPPDKPVNHLATAVLQRRPLYGHSHWAFFRQAELITGQLFNEAERKIFIDHVKIRRLRKRQYFLQEGDTCRYLGFIIKGATKTYSINERGQQSILSFNIEHDWVTDMESFLENKESAYHIEVLEDLEMLIMDLNQFHSLISLIPAMGQLVSCFQMKQLIEFQQRINAALSMTAEERYFNLLATKSNYVQRFSQNMLACYLGIKPATLSRIRKHCPKHI